MSMDGSGSPYPKCNPGEKPADWMYCYGHGLSVTKWIDNVFRWSQALGFKPYPCEGSFDLCKLRKYASVILVGIGVPNYLCQLLLKK